MCESYQKSIWQIETVLKASTNYVNCSSFIGVSSLFDVRRKCPKRKSVSMYSWSLMELWELLFWKKSLIEFAVREAFRGAYRLVIGTIRRKPLANKLNFHNCENCGRMNRWTVTKQSKFEEWSLAILESTRSRSGRVQSSHWRFIVNRRSIRPCADAA